MCVEVKCCVDIRNRAHSSPLICRASIQICSSTQIVWTTRTAKSGNIENESYPADKMSDGVDIDLYDNIEDEFNQVDMI